MQITIVLPSLNPNEQLEKLVIALLELGFTEIIVIDDGSDDAHQAPFKAVEALPHCTVLRHTANRGKGAALKTGFAHYLKMDKDGASVGVVTVDGDGQHTPTDILRCAQAVQLNPDKLVLGVRSFESTDIPSRSRYGNRFTSFVFKTICGINVSDTQTGLRGIGKENVPEIAALSGERFEYETNMLLETKRLNIDIKEISIDTVYEGDNRGSHFNPLRDSLRIYKLIFAFMLSSIAGWLVDISLFALFCFVFHELPLEWRILWSTVLARIGSSAVNYLLNRNAVFSSKTGAKASFLRYYGLCAVQMLISWGGVLLLSYFVGGIFGEVSVKLLVDTLLFFASFQLQRDWVFK